MGCRVQRPAEIKWEKQTFSMRNSEGLYQSEITVSVFNKERQVEFFGIWGVLEWAKNQALVHCNACQKYFEKEYPL